MPSSFLSGSAFIISSISIRLPAIPFRIVCLSSSLGIITFLRSFYSGRQAFISFLCSTSALSFTRFSSEPSPHSGNSSIRHANNSFTANTVRRIASARRGQFGGTGAFRSGSDRIASTGLAFRSSGVRSIHPLSFGAPHHFHIEPAHSTPVHLSTAILIAHLRRTDCFTYRLPGVRIRPDPDHFNLASAPSGQPAVRAGLAFVRRRLFDQTIFIIARSRRSLCVQPHQSGHPSFFIGRLRLRRSAFVCV